MMPKRCSMGGRRADWSSAPSALMSASTADRYSAGGTTWGGRGRTPVKGDLRPGETDAEGYLLARVPEHGQILVFGNDEHAVYVYKPTREGQHALDLLTNGST